LLPGVGSASAQTTLIAREPFEAPPSGVAYRVGTRVPVGATLYAVPQEVAVEVPAVRNYKYIRVNGRVVLVDPATTKWWRISAINSPGLG